MLDKVAQEITMLNCIASCVSLVVIKHTMDEWFNIGSDIILLYI